MLFVRLYFLREKTHNYIYAGFPTSWCHNKEVGGVDYQLLREVDTSAYKCLSNCLYETVDEPGRIYCFGSGNQTVMCEDEGK